MARMTAIEVKSPKGFPTNAIIMIDALVAGGIEKTDTGYFVINTEGRIPAIDGLRGHSMIEAWAGVVAMAQGGAVAYDGQRVQIGNYDRD